MFTAEIIEDPVWNYSNKQVSVSAIVSIKNGEDIIDTKPVSTSIYISTDDWKTKGYNALIKKAKNELIAYRANYSKIMADSGFSSPTEIIADLKAQLNTALQGV